MGGFAGFSLPPEQKGLNLTAVSWSAVRIAVIVCFLPRPADVRDAPDVRSAQPVSVSYCEEPSPAVGCAGGRRVYRPDQSLRAPAGALSGGLVLGGPPDDVAGEGRCGLNSREAPGLLTWCESWCEVCGLEEPKTRLAYHVIPGHRLEGVATLHNYLASIFTASGRPNCKRFQ